MKVKIFHGSRDCFEEVLLYKCCDIGFHCGTLEQALYRIMDMGKCYTETFFKSYVYEINIDIDNKNCIELPDCISWADFDNVKEQILHYYPSINIQEVKTLEELRSFLLDMGIKYIQYENKIEGKGYSYVILDENINFERYTVREIINKISEKYEGS